VELSNHRLASFIAEATVADLLKLPLPDLVPLKAREVQPSDFEQVDDLVKRALGLKEAEWALVSDFFTYTLPDFKQLPDAPGPKPTRREIDLDELHRYCDYFLRVLEAAFGIEHSFAATVFHEDNYERLSVRLAAIHLQRIGEGRIRHEPIASPILFDRLRKLESALRSHKKQDEGIAFQRVARVYSDFPYGRSRVPTLYLIKPDQVKYWIASTAMRDADEAFNDIMLWDRGGKAGPIKGET
jgi:hypothetical protein